MDNPRISHAPAILSERCRKTVEMALRYIEAGIVIVKTHAPIFSESGRVGCTCESYKRSDKYRLWCEENGKSFDPNYTCPNPGKHPVGNWRHETKGVAVEQVHDIWNRFHSVTDVDTGKRVKIVWNIGALTGPSDLLTLDADTYKNHYQCDLSDLIDLNDQETPTAITQSGGTHLLFDRQGRPYSNANGELKSAGIEGVDIRGEGGFQVLAPSVGPSGNKYGWVEGYEPWNVKRRPIPAALDALLAQTSTRRKNGGATTVAFTTPTTERPDLSQWRVSNHILELIHNPRPKGQRSEADYSVCLSLCYAGASDDDILAVFEHFPIGTNGSFAEKGRPYLAHTVANARAYVAAHPRPKVDAILAYYRHMVEFGDWSQIVPASNPSIDRKLFLNMLSIMERAHRVENVNISYRALITRDNSDGKSVQLAALQTAKNFLDRVNGTLINYSPNIDENGHVIGQLITLRPVFTDLDTSISPNSICLEVSKSVKTGTVVSAHLADDAFAIGTARWAREVINAEKTALMASDPAYAEAAMAYRDALKSKPENVDEMRHLMGAAHYDAYRELVAKAMAGFLPGLGTYGLLVAADLLDNPASDQQSIAERRGLKKSSVGTVLRKFDEWGLVKTSQVFGGRKYYTLVGDVFGEIDERLPESKTYCIGAQRLDRRLEKEQAWAAREAEQHRQAGNDEGLRLAEKRVNRIAQRRFETAPIAHPELDKDEVAKFIYVPGYMALLSRPEAPPMDEPGHLARLRLCELADNRDLLTEAELIELFTLNDMLGGNLQFEDSLVLANYYRRQAEQRAAIDATICLSDVGDDVENMSDALELWLKQTGR